MEGWKGIKSDCHRIHVVESENIFIKWQYTQLPIILSQF